MVHLYIGLSKCYKDAQNYAKTRKEAQRRENPQRHQHCSKTLIYSVKVPKRHQIGIQRFHLDKQRQL